MGNLNAAEKSLFESCRNGIKPYQIDRFDEERKDEKEINYKLIKIMNAIYGSITNAFRAYHENGYSEENADLCERDKISTEEMVKPEFKVNEKMLAKNWFKPRFKADQWVVNKHDNKLYKISRVNKDLPQLWVHGCGNVVLADEVHHATDEEMFQPGALIHYQLGESAIEGRIFSCTHKRVSFEFTGHGSTYSIEYCTLIEPPKRENNTKTRE